jgi:hypothetical protein
MRNIIVGEDPILLFFFLITNQEDREVFYLWSMLGLEAHGEIGVSSDPEV